jgi:tRNA A37 threonylcarbamoyladenosine biosynthesis protein TsaE
MRVFDSKSIEETIRFSHHFASKLSGSMNVVYLTGPVGCGKTLICREICKYYKIPDLTSASFQNVSHLRSNSLNVVHCDVYLNDLDDMAFEENILPLLTPNWLLLVEWSSKISCLSDIKHYSINIEITDYDNRLITLS